MGGRRVEVEENTGEPGGARFAIVTSRRASARDDEPPPPNAVRSWQPVVPPNDG